MQDLALGIPVIAQRCREHFIRAFFLPVGPRNINILSIVVGVWSLKFWLIFYHYGWQGMLIAIYNT